ncbi:MAG: YcxB family protein [Anaerolineales bacterium]
MKIKVQYTWEDLRNAHLLHMYPSRHFIVYFLAITMLGVFVYWLFTDLSLIYTAPPILIILAIGIGSSLVNRYISIPNQAKKSFAQQKAISLPFEFELTEAGVHISNELGNSNVPWNYFTKWDENEDIIILYQSDSLIHMLPKRFFTKPQELETINSLLEANKITKVKSGFRKKKTG